MLARITSQAAAAAVAAVLADAGVRSMLQAAQAAGERQADDKARMIAARERLAARVVA